MAEYRMNYEQIPAAARQVIYREDARCQREFVLDPNYAHAAEHRHLAGGALML
jgi:hypothetical protein